MGGDRLVRQELRPAEGAEIEAAARRVYELLTARNRRVKFETPEERRARVAGPTPITSAAAADLSRMLLGPVAAELGRKRLLIVSDGALHYLPFAALPEPGGGAASARCARARGRLCRRRRRWPCCGASWPGGGRRKDPRCVRRPGLREGGRAGARLQVRATASVEQQGRREHGAGKPFDRGLGGRCAKRDATKRAGAAAPAFHAPRGEGDTRARPEPRAHEGPRLRREPRHGHERRLGQYRFVHFATHGLLNSRHPELSGIVLSLVDERRPEQNGFLRVNEIFNLRLPAEMVVLSGCRTGLGKEIKGEGLVGLTRSFMYAGAERVIVSLWDVPDQASAELMPQLYREMLGAGSCARPPRSAPHSLKSASGRTGRHLLLGRLRLAGRIELKKD